jgi:hypothetical protein
MVVRGAGGFFARPTCIIAAFAVIPLVQAGCGGQSERDGNSVAAGRANSVGVGGTASLGAGGRPSLGGGGEGESGASAASGMTGFSSDDGVLTIPVGARPASSFMLALEEKATGIVGSFSRLDLAFGDEYPRKVTLDLTGSYLFDQAFRYFDAAGRIELTAVSAVSSGIIANRVDAEHFEVEVEAEGDFTIQLAGTWSPQEDDEPRAGAFAGEVLVRVRRVRATAVLGCGPEPRYVVSGAPFRTPYLQLTTEDGEQFIPANASGSRSVPLSVHATAGTRLSTPDGIGSLVAVGEDQTLSVRWGETELATFELVSQARVDGLKVAFQRRGPSVRGSLEVSSGGQIRIDVAGDQRHQIYAVPELSVSGVPVCSLVVSEWFVRSSRTPAVCPLTRVGPCDFCDAEMLPDGVNLEALGTCRFAVDAPELNAGAGLSDELSVEVLPPDGSGP